MWKTSVILCDMRERDHKRTARRTHITPRDNAHMPESYRCMLKQVNNLRATPTHGSPCQTMKRRRKIETYPCLSPRLIENLLYN